MRDTIGEALREDLETITKAASLIEREGWAVNDFVLTARRPRSTPVAHVDEHYGYLTAMPIFEMETVVLGRCILGAIYCAAEGRDIIGDGFVTPKARRAADRMGRTLMWMFPGPWVQRLDRFNDHPTTTKEHVMSLFAESIRRLQKELEHHEGTLAFSEEDPSRVRSGRAVHPAGSGEDGEGAVSVSRRGRAGRANQPRGARLQPFAGDPTHIHHQAAHQAHGGSRWPPSEVFAAHQEEDTTLALVAA